MGGAPSAQRLLEGYARTNRRRQRLIAVINACFDGFWLGVMDRDALAALDRAFYDERREFIGDASYAYGDDAYCRLGLHDWEAATIDAEFPAGGRVIVTGAGSGREVFALLERGFDVVGYEPNDSLRNAGAAFLRREGHPDRLHPVARDVFPPDAGRADALVVGWGSYMLIPGRSRRVDFLRAARRVLPEGAPLLVSFFVRDGDTTYFRLVSATANAVRRLRGLERADRGDTLDPNYVHYFTRDEIESELSAAGFRIDRFQRDPYGHALARAA